MATCCDSRTGCACIIVSGTGIRVSGSGTETDPYRVDSTVGGLSSQLQVLDTPTVDLTLTGIGTAQDPMVLSAVSAVKMTDLTDVQDPGGGPSAGEVPVWVGSTTTGHWEFQPPPVAPAGATNVGDGLSGDGSFATPIEVNTSGTWGSGDLAGLGEDSTIGLEVYIDADGNLRTQPVSIPSVVTVPWGSVTGKPTTFPPSAHNHDDLYTRTSALNNSLQTKANRSHTHSGSDITSGTINVNRLPPIPVNLLTGSGGIEGSFSAQGSISALGFVRTYENLLAAGTAGLVVNGNARIIGAYNTALSSSYRSLYVSNSPSNGLIGYVASTLAVKNLLGAYRANVRKLLDLPIHWYAYKDDVNQSPRLGLIAEEVNEFAPELVDHTEGIPDGVKYETLSVAVLALVQEVAAELESVKKSIGWRDETSKPETPTAAMFADAKVRSAAIVAAAPANDEEEPNG